MQNTQIFTRTDELSACLSVCLSGCLAVWLLFKITPKKWWKDLNDGWKDLNIIFIKRKCKCMDVDNRPQWLDVVDVPGTGGTLTFDKTLESLVHL